MNKWGLQKEDKKSVWTQNLSWWVSKMYGRHFKATALLARSAAVCPQLGRLVQRWNAAERVVGIYHGAEESVWVHLIFFTRGRKWNKCNIMLPYHQKKKKTKNGMDVFEHQWKRKNRFIKYFPWESKKLTLVWQWSIHGPRVPRFLYPLSTPFPYFLYWLLI